MLLLEIHYLCHNHSLAVFMRNRVQGAESNCCTGTVWPESFYHYCGQCAPSPTNPPVLWSPHPNWGLDATCSTGPFSPVSVVHSLGADMWAAVLSVHYENSWGFVCGEEKSYLSKLWRKKNPYSLTVSGEISGQVTLCVNDITYGTANDLWYHFVKQIHNQICFILLPLILVHWLLLAWRSTLINNLQDHNMLSRQLYSGKLFNYVLTLPAILDQKN